MQQACTTTAFLHSSPCFTRQLGIPNKMVITTYHWSLFTISGCWAQSVWLKISELSDVSRRSLFKTEDFVTKQNEICGLLGCAVSLILVSSPLPPLVDGVQQCSSAGGLQVVPKRPASWARFTHLFLTRINVLKFQRVWLCWLRFCRRDGACFSHLGPETSYLNWGCFSWFFPVPPGKWLYSTLN
jgi:hypothetical protein